jgi:hypothetical protein
MKLPLDCIGVIIEYIEDSKIIINLFQTCKNIRYFIYNEYPQCCKNIIFNATSFISKGMSKFVIKLYISGYVKNISSKTISNIPYVSYVSDDVGVLSNKYLSKLMRLSVLKLSPKYMRSYSSLLLPKLKELYIKDGRCCDIYKSLYTMINLEILVFGPKYKTQISSKCINTLTKLRILEAPSVTFYGELINNKKLTYLRIGSFYGSGHLLDNSQELKYVNIGGGGLIITRETFLNLKHAHTLIFDLRVDIEDEDLKYVSKSVKHISLPYCNTITYKGIRNNIQHNCTVEFCSSTDIEYRNKVKLFIRPYIGVSLCVDYWSKRNHIDVVLKALHFHEKMNRVMMDRVHITQY